MANTKRTVNSLNKGIYQIINYIFAADVPWHFRLLVIMVIIFFAGGLYLDFLASKISLRLPELAATLASPNEIVIEAIKEHTKNKVDNLSSSAKLLYDFSKIALGALLASLSSVIKEASIRKKTSEKESTNE